MLLKGFLFLALAAILLAEQNHLGNFGRGSSKEHSCEIISKSIQWTGLGGDVVLRFSIFSSGRHFV